MLSSHVPRPINRVAIGLAKPYLQLVARAYSRKGSKSTSRAVFRPETGQLSLHRPDEPVPMTDYELGCAWGGFKIYALTGLAALSAILIALFPGDPINGYALTAQYWFALGGCMGVLALEHGVKELLTRGPADEASAIEIREPPDGGGVYQPAVAGTGG